MSKIKLHRCKYTWVKINADACWVVEKALRKQGIDYDVVKYPKSRAQRDEVERLSGQRLVPVIEFEDGSAYREESSDMAAAIAAGELFKKGKPASANRGELPWEGVSQQA